MARLSTDEILIFAVQFLRKKSTLITMSMHTNDQEALQYHQQAPAGKLGVYPTKPLQSQKDLALAYSPGVGAPCKAIAEDGSKVFSYTGKGNLVAVVSNGTAVLGLGNIGPEAAKPVMEGKAILLKQLTDIDAFDLELDATDPAAVIEIVRALAPTFGGINLEDIKAPECFEIEETLDSLLPIPVMHDDQHGTAITSGAALLNALALVDKNIGDIQLVINGAGAGAIACARLYLALGVKPANIVMCDSKGVIHKGRQDLNAYKAAFATDRPLATLTEALRGADVFLGLSVANVVTPAHLQAMAERPIVFALANPDAEIAYEVAMGTRNDLIMATGRSDHPNQVNNILCFPYLFRGALDVRATTINEAMKLAAVQAIAGLAKEPVPAEIKAIYGNAPLAFGKDYLLPKPMDPRLITTVSGAVAKAAMASGVAQVPIKDWVAYYETLQQRLKANS